MSFKSVTLACQITNCGVISMYDKRFQAHGLIISYYEVHYYMVSEAGLLI